MNAIETHELTKFYGTARGIERVDLTVPEGDFFGFIGPNGAGKSTTIRLLMGLIHPTLGSASVLGKSVNGTAPALLSQIGYLPSEAAFYAGMTVKDLLVFSGKMRGAECAAERERLCERLALDPKRKIGELSLGNKKKVGIVCALQHNPRLIILDEPTSGLDPLMQREFFDILEERNRAGATVFLSSHVLTEISRYCRHAAVIRDGKVVTSDSVVNLGHTGVKRVTLRGCHGDHLPDGASRVSREGETVSFLYSGRPDALIRELSSLAFDDFSVSDPDLEEVVMQFYAGEGEKQ